MTAISADREGVKSQAGTVSQSASRQGQVDKAGVCEHTGTGSERRGGKGNSRNVFKK